MNESNQTKEDFIKAQGLPVLVGCPLTELFFLAQVKSRITSSCFGSFFESDDECKDCYLASRGLCQKLTKYLIKFRGLSKKDNVVRITTMDGAPLDSIAIDAILEKIGFRTKTTKSYMIAQLILSSDGKRMDVLKNEILAIIGPKSSLRDVAVRISQITSRIHQFSDIRITRETVKFLKILRQKEPTQ